MSFRDELEAQSEAWVDEGLISGDQRQAILARTPEAESVWSSRLVPGLAIFGAVVVVLGLILLVSANWDEIPLGVKLAAGIALLATVQAVGYWLAFGPLSRRNTGLAIMLVGAGIFLGDLALVAQQYNVEENPSRLILVTWLLGLAALPYLFRSRVFALAGAAVLVAGLAAEAGHDRSPIDVEWLAGILMFVAVGLGVAAIGAAHRLTRYASLAPPIEATGIVVAGALLYQLGFYRHFVDSFDSEVAWETASAPWLLIGVPAVITLGVATAWLLRSGAQLSRREDWPVAAAAIAALALIAYVTLVLISPREADEDEFIVWTVGFWIAELVLPAVVIWLGVVTNRSWWTNVALLYLGLFVITRYFDTFGDYTQTGVLFVGAGLLLLLVAFALERSRRVLAELSEREA
jgi:uncharacterized membrane protein